MRDKLLKFRHRAWLWVVCTLITWLEADLRGRALDWLYNIVQEDAAWGGHGRYARSGGRYHRESRWNS